MVKGNKIAYYGLGFAHSAVVFYYCSVAFLATLGLILQNTMLGTTHFFLFAGIAGSQVASGRRCPLTDLQNKYAKKLGKKRMDTFIGHSLGWMTGWQPGIHNLRRAAVMSSVIIFTYYGIVVFGLL